MSRIVWRSASLRGRLFAAIALIVMCSLGLTLAVGLVLTRRSVEDATRKELAEAATLLARREQGALLPLARLDVLRPVLAQRGERVETRSLSVPSSLLPRDQRARLRRGLPTEGSVELGGQTYFYAARRVRVGRENRALILLRRARVESADWRPFAESLLLAGLVGAALAALVSLILARAITRPVRLVADASRSLAAGGSPDPIPVEGSDELARLAASFNDMAAQLARARDLERAFLLSVSHELKTPLTSIRGYAEAITERAVDGEEAAETILVEARRLERLVHDLLDLARMNRSSFEVHAEPVDLAEVAREAVRRYETQAQAFEVDLEAVVDGPAPAVGDHDRLVQVVSNLVENALRSTPAGGTVRVSAGAGALVVADEGPGIHADELPRAFERFYLFDRYRSRREVGTGLGLAIVKELTEAMGGSVDVQSEPGAGTAFTVRLRPVDAWGVVPRGPVRTAAGDPG